MIDIGRVVRAHGVRGELRVAGAGPSLARLARVLVGDDERRLASARPAGDAWIVKLEGVDDRDAADALRGLPLRARRDDLPPADPDELYVADLVGCTVLDRGAPVGVVREVLPSGPQELLVIDRPDGRESLVPFVEPLVSSVDLESRRILCDLPEGLLEP